MATNRNSGETEWAVSRNQDLENPRLNAMDSAAEHRLYRALRHFWHPVIYSAELSDEPEQVMLCGEQLVVVRLDGEVHVFNDICSHRGAALSLGKVVASDVGQTLQCPYHGWRYDGRGHCVLAPQRPDLAGLLRARIKGYRAVERYGMVWVCLEDQPHYALPEFPQFDDPTFDLVYVPSTTWDHTFAVRRTENYTDPAHLAFVHDGFLGDSSAPEIPALDVHKISDNVLQMRLAEPVLEPASALKNRSLDTDKELLSVMKTWDVSMPLTVNLRAWDDTGNEYVLFFHPTPTSATTTRNFTIGARNYGSSETIYEEIVGWNEMVYEQDLPIVSSQRPELLPEDLSFEMYLAGVDTFSLQYRKWLIDLADELVPADRN